MEISETNGVQPCQAIKENSPTSGLLRFLVARGGIDQGLRCQILLKQLIIWGLEFQQAALQAPVFAWAYQVWLVEEL